MDAFISRYIIIVTAYTLYAKFGFEVETTALNMMTKYTRFPNKALQDTYLNVTNLSPAECCSLCNADTLCEAVNYHQPTKLCQLNNISSQKLAADRPGWTTYATKLPEPRPKCDIGELRHPYYPEKYPENTRCVWSYTVEASHKVILSFQHLNLETDKYDISKCHDYIFVNGSDQNDGRIYCHPTSLTQLSHVISSSNTINVTFYSDDGDTSNFAFNATIASDPCGTFVFENDCKPKL